MLFHLLCSLRQEIVFHIFYKNQQKLIITVFKNTFVKKEKMGKKGQAKAAGKRIRMKQKPAG